MWKQEILPFPLSSFLLELDLLRLMERRATAYTSPYGGPVFTFIPILLE